MGLREQEIQNMQARIESLELRIEKTEKWIYQLVEIVMKEMKTAEFQRYTKRLHWEVNEIYKEYAEHKQGDEDES